MAKGRGGFIGQDGLNAPDSPTGVSASAGDAQATVSFTAPTDVGGSAITGYNVQATPSAGTLQLPGISAASYDNVSFTTSSPINHNREMQFNSDGTKMYTIDDSDDKVYQFSLSSAYDISTASYDSVSLDISSQLTGPQGFCFNNNGTSLYAVGENNDTVYQYTLSSAYNLSTGSYASKSFSIGSQQSVAGQVQFNNTGTRMYIAGESEDKVFQYTLSSAFDVSTASYNSVNFDHSSQDTTVTSMAFNSDGTKMFLLGRSSNAVHQYSLSSAYDLSTTSYDNVSFSVTGQATTQQGITFNADDTKMYITDYGTNIYQYTSNLSSTTITSSPATITGLTNGTSYTFNVWAINAFGYSAPSASSDAVSPALARGLFGGGDVSGNTIDYIDIGSTGNATDFGDLTANRNQVAALASVTRGVFGMGDDASSSIDYVTIASTGNASDFGDPSVNRTAASGLSNNTRGIFAGGASGGTFYDTIDYITIASTGNATDFGNYNQDIQGTGACASSTRGIIAGGINSSYSRPNNINYVTIASTGNVTDFGDLTDGTWMLAGFSSSTRGIFAGGNRAGSEINNIDYITIASTGNATDFGDLATAVQSNGGLSSEARGVSGGGRGSTGGINEMQYITIASTGNASDFGDLTVARQKLAGCSSAHGGLQ